MGSGEPTHRLSNRQIELLELMSHGITGIKILAQKLEIAPSTVKNQLNKAYAKLGLSDAELCAIDPENRHCRTKSILAVRVAVKNGILSEYEPPLDQTKTRIFEDGLASLGLERDR